MNAPKIAIQGYEGSFHQVAAKNIFGKNVAILPCASFRELVKMAEDKSQTDGAIMAIENSTAGSILLAQGSPPRLYESWDHPCRHM